MSEISVRQYLAEQGGTIPWEEAVRLMLPVMNELVAEQEPEMFHINLNLEQLQIDTETNRVCYKGEKVPFSDVNLAERENNYLPWELYNSWSRRGSASEVYSVAGCLYTMIGGAPLQNAAERVEQDRVGPLAQRGIDLPRRVEEVILKGLALNPADRWNSVEEFKEALVAAAEQTSQTASSADAREVGSTEPIDISSVPVAYVSKALEATLTHAAREDYAKEASIPRFVPLVAITASFCLGLMAYQIVSRQMPTVMAGLTGVELETQPDAVVAPVLPTEVEATEPQDMQIVQYEDGSVYEGEWNKEKRNGYGILTLADGSVYEGNWVDDALNGTAKVQYVLDAEQGWTSSFEGLFQSDAVSGQGTYFSVGGHVQSGAWSVTDGQNLAFGAQNATQTLPAEYQGMLNDTVPGGYGQAVWIIDKDHKIVYTGEWENGVPTGKGTLTAVDGSMLSGEWSYGSEQDVKSSAGVSGRYTGLLLEGKPAGFGIAVWSDGTVSITEYKGAVRSGYGISYSKNGEQYAGLWSADAKNGNGICTWADGSKFVGVWSGTQRTGTLTTAAGDTYKGTWKNDLMEGTGTYRSHTGETYTGNWTAGQRSGTGTYKWANGNVYTGSWSKNQPNGTGTMSYANGESYTGIWTNGEHSDTGTYKLVNGDVYEGTLSNGQKEGTGTYTWANGDSYKGSWQEDIQNGQGTFSYANGDTYTGMWVNGQRSGTGTYKWVNGDSYTGAWLSDLKNGDGVYTWANGTTYKGTWINGEPIKGGTYTYTDEGVSELMLSGSLTMLP